MDLIQIEEKKGKSVEEQKEQLLALLHGKLGPTLDKKQGIASCEILSEEIAEDGNTAVVKAKITYGDGQTVGATCKALYDKLQDIQYGRVEDMHGWCLVVE